MTESEYKEEMKKELKKEIMTEMNQSDEDDVDLKKQVKILLKKLESYQDLEKKYLEISKKYEHSVNQLDTIKNEIKKEKKIKNNK